MRPRYVSHGIGHGDHGETEGERDPKQADADLRQAGADDGGAAARKGQPESADEFGGIAFCIVHESPKHAIRYR